MTARIFPSTMRPSFSPNRDRAADFVFISHNLGIVFATLAALHSLHLHEPQAHWPDSR